MDPRSSDDGCVMLGGCLPLIALTFAFWVAVAMVLYSYID